MPYIMTDIETDGLVPGIYSMITIGAVVVESGLGRTFSTKLRSMADDFVPEALSVSGFTRDQTLTDPFRDPPAVMEELAGSLGALGRDRSSFRTTTNLTGYLSHDSSTAPAAETRSGIRA
jgi:DNA polymerase III epsilon subunit-like protein